MPKQIHIGHIVRVVRWCPVPARPRFSDIRSSFIAAPTPFIESRFDVPRRLFPNDSGVGTIGLQSFAEDLERIASIAPEQDRLMFVEENHPATGGASLTHTSPFAGYPQCSRSEHQCHKR